MFAEVTEVTREKLVGVAFLQPPPTPFFPHFILEWVNRK